MTGRATGGSGHRGRESRGRGSRPPRPSPNATRPRDRPEVVIWHDVECGGYSADLELWEELAALARGHILELGCGTGRVALHLARRGHDVLGLDLDEALVAELNARAGPLGARAVTGDARAIALGGEFALALAPMQLIQLVADRAERASCLRGISAHLRPGGVAALAIVEDVPPGAIDRGAVLPDTREVGDTIYASMPLEIAAGDEEIVVRRLRQTVTRAGRLREKVSEVTLRSVSAAELEREARAAGLEPLRRRRIPPTADHVGSTVVVARKGER